MNYTLETNEDPLKTPTLIVHTEGQDDLVVKGINSLNLKFSKKGRGKGTNLIVNITVPGFIDGEPCVKAENFSLPQDLKLVTKATKFWEDHGINLTRETKTNVSPTNTKKIIATKEVTEVVTEVVAAP